MPYDSHYHTEEQLLEIQNWDINQAHKLVDRLREMWQYENYFIEKWGDHDIHEDRPVLNLELHTGGWSGNEDIIEALRKNKLFWTFWWEKSERGGHFYFQIDFSQIGFKQSSKFIKDNNFSRQYLHKTKDKFEWIIISQNKRLLRKPITTKP